MYLKVRARQGQPLASMERAIVYLQRRCFSAQRPRLVVSCCRDIYTKAILPGPLAGRVCKPHHTTPHHATGKWITTPATDCDSYCGSAKAGTVRCSKGKDAGCDPTTKPLPKQCPKTAKCSEFYAGMGIISEQTEGNNV